MLFNPSNVLTVQDQLIKLQNDEYSVAQLERWDSKIFAQRTSGGAKDIFNWYLQTSKIDELPFNSMLFDDLASVAFTVENKDFGKGLRLSANQFKDDQLEGAASWSKGMGFHMAIFPQIQAASLLQNGTSRKGWDGVNFFSASHPVNPFDAAVGTYSNLVTTTPLTAASLASVVAGLEVFKLPNGDYRRLKATHLLHPPQLKLAAQTATKARFITNAVGAAAATTENVVTDYNITPISAPELSGEADVWYVIAQEGGTFGKPLVEQVREDFAMTDYTGITQAQLNRDNMVEWHVRGRRAYAYGNPFQIIRVQST